MASNAGRLAHAHGTAVIDVWLEPGRPRVEVLPGNVASIQAAGVPAPRSASSGG
jgi:hypothetical protein